MELNDIVPWGRSFLEYKEIFSLTDSELKKKILGCGDGPACFNAELTASGGNVVSVDPVYQFNEAQIRSRIDAVYPQVMAQVSQNAADFVWQSIASVAELGKVRMQAMSLFLNDYTEGKAAQRYVEGALPELPFADAEFDLALCSHYLFLYSDHVSQENHLLSLLELCRVAKEVRIYPLITLSGDVSKHLDPVISLLKKNNVKVSLQTVQYQFQKGATQMLVARV
ncbi:MAG: SAM-dependent methyltransferase [Methylococcales bacterium]|jgi:hypothetical protein|nr:SAM-dependent methyltransferase [Methylococcales bacterium]MBT7442360.1 SAM-dependent methyltransferase [Methylococcales bacterium]